MIIISDALSCGVT